MNAPRCARGPDVEPAPAGGWLRLWGLSHLPASHSSSAVSVGTFCGLGLLLRSVVAASADRVDDAEEAAMKPVRVRAMWVALTM